MLTLDFRNADTGMLDVFVINPYPKISKVEDMMIITTANTARQVLLS